MARAGCRRSATSRSTRARRRGGGVGRARAAVLGQAGAAGLVGGHRAGRRRGRARRRAGDGVRARPAGDRRGERRRARGRVLGARHTTTPKASRPARSCCAGRRLVRLRGEVRAGRMELVVPARISDAARERPRAGGDAFRLAGCSGLARVDFFVDGTTCCSTSSTRCPASRRRASTRSCGSRAACRTGPVDRLVVARGRALRGRARAPVLIGGQSASRGRGSPPRRRAAAPTGRVVAVARPPRRRRRPSAPGQAGRALGGGHRRQLGLCALDQDPVGDDAVPRGRPLR